MFTSIARVYRSVVLARSAAGHSRPAPHGECGRNGSAVALAPPGIRRGPVRLIGCAGHETRLAPYVDPTARGSAQGYAQGSAQVPGSYNLGRKEADAPSRAATRERSRNMLEGTCGRMDVGLLASDPGGDPRCKVCRPPANRAPKVVLPAGRLRRPPSPQDMVGLVMGPLLSERRAAWPPSARGGGPQSCVSPTEHCGAPWGGWTIRNRGTWPLGPRSPGSKF